MFGCLEQFPALARPVLRQQRVAAYHQPLARIQVAANLHQVLFVEQGHLHRPAVHQLADRRPAQRTDPVHTGRLHFVADACLGPHPPVAHQHHPLKTETVLELADLRTRGGRIGSVPPEHLHRHRTAFGIAQQAELDLQLAPLVVTGMSPGGQPAATAFRIHGGQIVQHQRTIPQMPPGQAVLDLLLALNQPVHGRVQVMLVAVGNPQGLAQGVPGARLRPAPDGAEPGPGMQDACCHHPQHPVPLGTGRPDDLRKVQLADGAEHRGHMSVGQGPGNLEAVFEPGQCGAALEQRPESFDEVWRPPGEIGQGAFPDSPAFAAGFTQEDGGRGFAVGDGFHEQGHGYCRVM